MRGSSSTLTRKTVLKIEWTVPETHLFGTLVTQRCSNRSTCYTYNLLLILYNLKLNLLAGKVRVKKRHVNIDPDRIDYRLTRDGKERSRKEGEDKDTGRRADRQLLNIGCLERTKGRKQKRCNEDICRTRRKKGKKVDVSEWQTGIRAKGE